MSNVINYTIKGNSMYPTFRNGDTVTAYYYNLDKNILIGDLVVFRHPFKKNLKLIKRVTKIKNSKLFVEGDNKNILCSDDSHQFGYINSNNIISLINNNSC